MDIEGGRWITVTIETRLLRRRTRSLIVGMLTVAVFTGAACGSSDDDSKAVEVGSEDAERGTTSAATPPESNAQTAVLCEALFSLVVAPSGPDATPDVDRSRFGPLVDQLGDGVPDELRDDVLYLRELLRPFESNPDLTWDAYVETIDGDAQSKGVAATRRLNEWAEANCDPDRIAEALGVDEVPPRPTTPGTR